MAWILANKEWLFSGVGISLILLIWVVLRALWKRGKRESRIESAYRTEVTLSPAVQSPTAPTQPAVRSTRISALTIEEITAPIRDAPPLQRASVAKRYEGIVVQWKAKLRSAYPREDGSARLVLRFDDYPFQSVACAIKLSDYPELGVLPNDTLITVTGRISRADGYDVELEDAQLDIHPAGNPSPAG